MDRWRGRVAVVTGASAGIGAAVVRALLRHGVTVVGVARRADRVQVGVGRPVPAGEKEGVVYQQLGNPRQRARACETLDFQEIAKTHSYPGKLHAVEADLSKDGDIQAAFRWLKDNLGRVVILVNNAGVFSDSQLTEGSTEEFRRMLEVNVLGLTLCTKEAVNLMRAKGIGDGHIVNIGSVAGHWLPLMSEGAFYYGTKHAVRVLSEGLRREFLQRDSSMKVTEISPGVVATDIFDKQQHLSRDVVLKHPHIMPEDIADAVIYVLGAPSSVLVHEMMVMPVKQKHLSEL
ncbi:farnesol dehydrogenase-like [Schistocerca piceifrons]|uniref:farnesol dehydrogenase-like n=1 Tax=Schistocerca piceifrons TaxID=274613 RepID=UPI001F5E53F4|nr:farnesol dehydrogenase-like [Schistocerca piceifrons]